MTASLDLIEQAKRAAAFQAVAEHFQPSFTHVGIGSGSTVRYVVEAIAESVAKAGSSQIVYIPTGSGSRDLVDAAGLTVLPFDDLPASQMLDVAFDGADEVDDEFNLVKGGGACLFQEKLVAARAKKFVCVADSRKNSDRLLKNWTYVPIEVAPFAVQSVLNDLRALGSPKAEVRKVAATAEGPVAPLRTDQNFYIVMAPFPPLLLQSEAAQAGGEGKTTAGEVGRVWEVNALASAIKMIPGVLEVGLFVGVTGPEAIKAGGQGGQKPVAVYFGMPDGSVQVRKNAA